MEKSNNFKDSQIINFKEFENKLNGESTSEFHQIRKRAFDTFLNLDFPTIKNEEWKYTDISPIINLKFNSPAYRSINKEQFENYLFDENNFHTMVFVNGIFSKELSSPTINNKKIIITNLAEQIKINPELVQRYLSKLIKQDRNTFLALNTAFTADGVFINIGDNVVFERPVQILYINTGEEYNVTYPRNLFIAGKNSQIKVLETYMALSTKSYFTNSVTEVYLNEGAIVEHIKIEDENLNAFHISNTEISQESNSNYSSYNINFGGKLVRTDINAKFNNKFAECTLNGLYLAQREQLIDNHTLIDHAQPHCLSHELYKGILDGNSRGVFNGKVLVRKDAQKTNAFQENKNLLLSKDALMNTKPQLEIFADDVKCSHGATVGQLDKNALFYLRSRGLGEEEAKVLLIYAFASDVVHSISIKEVRDHLEELLANKLL